MTSDLVTVTLVILAAILLTSPWSLRQLRRFDQGNRERIEAETRDRRDTNAHFRHTLELAEEQVEDVSSITISDPRTGNPVKRWLFEGEQFMNEDDARAVRAEKLRAIAIGYYRELPAALAAREDDKLRSN
ncbi:MAG: hypothetical protein JOZ72_16350 [Alphaproteobacteria bacterium]|nr:hypothetical protein [Alphaproteobacteria bacterium]